MRIFLDECSSCNRIWAWKVDTERTCPDCGMRFGWQIRCQYHGEDQGMLLVFSEELL